MEGIVLCPKCRVRVAKDDLGELICPKCGARICPKAHIFEGKICSQCGWEDPNYYLWQRRQRTGVTASAGERLGEYRPEKSGRICPKCGVDVEPGVRRCPNCGWLFPVVHGIERAIPVGMQQPDVRETTVSEHRPSGREEGKFASPRSPILRDTLITTVGRREWDFSKARRFIQPVGAGLFVLGVVAFLVWGSIAAVKHFGGKIGDSGSDVGQTTPVQTNTGAGKVSIFNPAVMPPGGGKIIWSPEGNAFLPGTAIVLSAEPADCYVFDRWEGIESTSPEATINFDPQSHITAYFKLKDAVAPTISEARVAYYSDVGATVKWQTNEPARGKVEYGVTTDYGQVVEESELSTEHAVRLSGLSAGKTYYFRITSRDECSNEAAAQTGRFTTLSFVAEGAGVGERAPDFTLPSYKDDYPGSPNNPKSPTYIGDQVSLSQFRGKWVFLNLWNTFCAACLGEFPHIMAFYEDESWANRNSPDAEYVVLTVCLDGRIDRIMKLEEKYKYQTGLFTFPILVDDAEKRTLTGLYRVTYVPVSLFIDPDGVIRAVKMGQFKSEEEIKQLLGELD